MTGHVWILLFCALAWLLLLPLAVLGAVLLLSCFLVRKWLDIIVRLWQPDWRPIYPPDSPSWFQRNVQTSEAESEQKCRGNITGLLTVKEVVSIEELREAVVQRLLEPRLGSDWQNWKMRMVPCTVLGYFYWKPAAVEVEKHVWEHVLRAEERLEDFVAAWSSRGFCGRPLWEFVLLRPKSGSFQDKSVVLLKFSHAIGDGVLLKLVLEALCHKEHSPEVVKMRRSWAQVLFHAGTLPWVLYKLALLRGKNHYHLKPGQESSKSVLSFDWTELSLVKAAAKATRVPFREVLVCTVASALRRYWLESQKASALPEFLAVGVALPALRYTRSFEVFANRGSVCFFSYPLRPSCPLERLRLAHADCVENLRTGQHELNFFGVYLAYVLPLVLSAGGVSLVTTDVCSQERPHLFGKYLTSSRTFGAISLQGLPFSSFGCFYTCEKTVAFSLTFSAELVPDQDAAQRLSAYFKQELSELLRLGIQALASGSDSAAAEALLPL